MQFGTLKEIIAQCVNDGQSVALEGFTHLIPFAAGHEILRQKKSDLHLIRMTPDLIYDQLIGAGCARRDGGVLYRGRSKVAFRNAARLCRNGLVAGQPPG